MKAIIQVEHADPAAGCKWLVTITPPEAAEAVGSESTTCWDEKTEATNHGRAVMRDLAEDHRVLAELFIYGISGYLLEHRALGPGARTDAPRVVSLREMDLDDVELEGSDPYYEQVAGEDEIYGSERTRQRPKLTRRQRRRLPASAFAIPERRAYPIPDSYHAMKALQFLTRVAGRWGTAGYEDTARRVLAAVARRYPGVYEENWRLVEEIEDLYGISAVRRAADW